jgi:hypothetical protein
VTVVKLPPALLRVKSTIKCYAIRIVADPSESGLPTQMYPVLRVSKDIKFTANISSSVAFYGPCRALASLFGFLNLITHVVGLL